MYNYIYTSLQTLILYDYDDDGDDDDYDDDHHHHSTCGSTILGSSGCRLMRRRAWFEGLGNNKCI